MHMFFGSGRTYIAYLQGMYRRTATYRGTLNIVAVPSYPTDTPPVSNNYVQLLVGLVYHSLRYITRCCCCAYVCYHLLKHSHKPQDSKSMMRMRRPKAE